MEEITIVMKSKPKIIIPNEDKLSKLWFAAKSTFGTPLTKWEKICSFFVLEKELVHPIDKRIFRHKSINGKTFKIGRMTNGFFKKAKDFKELESWNACRYLSHSGYNKAFGIKN